MTIRNLVVLSLLILSLSSSLWGQGWERLDLFRPSSPLKMDLCYAQDSSVIMLSTTHDDSINFQTRAAWLRKIDPAGNLVWEKKYRLGLKDEGIAIHPLQNGGFTMLVNSTDSNYVEHFYLYRLTEQGDSLWTRKSFEGLRQEGNDVLQAKDGNLVALIRETPALGQTDEVVMAKYSLQGDTLWKKRYNFNFTTWNILSHLIETSDSSLWVSGWLDAENLIVKCTPLGDTLWTRKMATGASLTNSPVPMVPGPLGGIKYGTIVQDTTPGSQAKIPSMVHLNASGMMVQQTYYPQHPNQKINLLSINPTGGYVLGGSYQGAPNGGSDLSLIHMDAQGTFLSMEDHGTLYNENIYDLLFTQSGRKYIAGTHYPQSVSANKTYLLKTNASGSVHTNWVRGLIFDDLNSNCQPETGEPGLSQWVVRLTPGPFWGITDSMGFYELPADTGAFMVEAFPPYPYRSITCPVAPHVQSGFLAGEGQVMTGLNFATEASDSCPLLWVDVSAPRLNYNGTTQYSLIYCNHGTQPENNVSVTLFSDPSMQIDSAFPTWTLPQSGNEYVFDVGTLNPGECGRITLYSFLPASAAPVGLTHCMRAEIDPHTSCQNVNPGWDGASLTVSGACVNDTARFTITNVGTGNMVTPGGLLVHEDDILRVSDQVQLTAGQDTILFYPGRGSTWTCRVTQTPGHPGVSTPRAYVEACDTNAFGTFSTGFVNHFPENDLDDWASELCLQSFGNWNLYGMIGFPTGVTSENLIQPNRRIEYQTTFENRTMQGVEALIIRADLPKNLDLRTLTLGGYSHPHTFDLLPNGTGEWRFHEALTDSVTSLVRSMAVANYRIDQFPNMPEGTVYFNRATLNPDNFIQHSNGAEHVLSDTAFGAFRIFTNIDPVQPPLAALLKVYPNPVKDLVTFELTQEIKGKISLEIVDLTGRTIRVQSFRSESSIQLTTRDLRSGLYLFRLSSETGILGTGKFWVL